MDGGIHPACGRGVGPGWLLLHSDRKMRSGSRGVGGASIPLGAAPLGGGGE